MTINHFFSFTIVEINTRQLYIRLYHDCLENFFGSVKQQCGNNKNRTPVQFQRCFKKLFCLNYFLHSEGSKCIENIAEVLQKVVNVCATNVYIIKLSKAPFQSLEYQVSDTSYRDLDWDRQNALTTYVGTFRSV